MQAMGRPGWVSTSAPWSASSAFEFAEWVLRGIGVVVLQNNPLSGALILAALFLNSAAYGLACVVGTAIGTLTAMVLGADRRMVRDGLFGFNGALTGIGLVAFTSQDFATGTMPGFHLWLYIALAAVSSTVLVGAFATLLGHERLPGLTFPFCAATSFFLAALQQITVIDVSLALHPPSPCMLPPRGPTAGRRGSWGPSTEWRRSFFKTAGSPGCSSCSPSPSRPRSPR